MFEEEADAVGEVGVVRLVERGVLMDNFSPSQYDRFELYRRCALPKQAVRKVGFNLDDGFNLIFYIGYTANFGVPGLPACHPNHSWVLQGFCG